MPQKALGRTPVLLPTPVLEALNIVSTNTLIDGSTEKVAAVFVVPRTGTLSGVELLLGTVSQAPSNGVKFSFQDVDLSTGNPDGSADQYRVVTSGISSSAWLASGVMDDAGTGSGNKRSVTRGQILSLVMEFQSFNASDSVRWAIFSTIATNPGHFPFVALNTGSWAKNTVVPIIVLKYDDNTYEQITFPLGPPPIKTITSLSYASDNVTQDEAGMRFIPASRMTVSGVWAAVDADENCDLILYDASNNVLGSFSVDKDVRRTTTGGVFVGLFSSDVELTPGNTYRISIKPTTTTNIALSYYTVDSADILNATQVDSSWQWTQRVDAGAWSDTATQRPFAGLVVSKFSDGINARKRVHNI